MNALSDGAAPNCDDNPVVGTLTIVFDTPVTNPILHFNNLDAAEYFFLDGVTLTRLSGDNNFDVSGANVHTNPVPASGFGCNNNDANPPPAACGSVMAVGTFTQLRMDFTDVAIGISGDGHFITMSLVTPPLQLCTTDEVRATQRYWFFGINGAIDFDISGTTPTAFLGSQSTSEGSTVVTDSTGQLLFWSNGQTVFDRNSNPMPNGTGLLGEPSAVQTVAAFPAAGQPGIYFVVTTNASIGVAPNGDLTYSIVDMSLNGGLGAVTATKNVALGAADTASEALTAVPNADGTGFWVVTQTNNSSNVLAYEFDSNGPVIGTPVVSVMSSSNLNAQGNIYFNADLTEAVSFSGNQVSGVVRVLSFDAETGRFFERLTWSVSGKTSLYTADFSPAGDYIYLSEFTAHLFRYRIAGAATGADVLATEEDLGAISSSQGGHVRRAPDGRMYVAANTETALGVVNDPDNAVDPDFEPAESGFPLAPGAASWYGLPQMVTGCPPIPYDFGDAPDSYGTLVASNGPQHALSGGLVLGTTIDVEDDGQPTTNADGDDADGTDDEDAFTVMPPMATSQTGYSVAVPVINTSGGNASLVGWVDWNQNGLFDVGEGVASVVANNATEATLSWSGLSGLTSGNTYARLRLAAEGEIDANTPGGVANSGEVEDYIFPLAVPPEDIFSFCPISTEPPPTNFTIKERWRTPGTQTVAYQTPLVGDLDGDGAPEVVVGANANYAAGFGDGGPATGRLTQDLHILRGSDGTILDTIDTPYYSWSGTTPHALVDVNGDGQAEIIFKVAGHTVGGTDEGKLIAYNNDGTILWTSDQRYDYGESRGGQGINVADFNSDGNPEVFVGNQIFNAQTGARLASLTAADSSGCPYALSGSCYFGNAVAVDMDGDGQLELVAGNVVYKVNLVNLTGEAGNSLTVWKQAATTPNVGDGQTAVADIDLDGDPDVIVVRAFNGTISNQAVMYVWDGQTSTIMGITPLLTANGSQPFIGDIDGDSQPEIVFVTVNALRAYDYVDGVGLQVKWTSTASDSSGATTLTMFDFNSDGVTELVYRDEQNLRIINGSGAAAANLTTIACTSGTDHDMPVVADIDGSGMAQILVNCSDSDFIQGDVRAFTTNSFPWANARPVWNQQAYFVSHINNDLTVPADQFPHWTTFSDEGTVCSQGVNRPLNAFLLQVGDLDLTTGCPVVCQSADFGDAPASYGTLLDTNDGARHSVLGFDSGSNTAPLMLGSLVDTDADGQPSANADGDDVSGTAVDDEDGVTLTSALAPGQSLQIPVQVTGTGGRLHAWIDWNQDGDFGDVGEQIATDVGVVAGANNINVTVPADAVLGTTYARFRLTTQSTLGPTGAAAGGEVEDYAVVIAIPVLASTKRDVVFVDADVSGTASPGDTLRYTVIITNSGVGTALNASYSDTPDPNTSLVVGNVTTTQGSVTTGNGGGDSTVAVAIGNIPPSGVVTIVYDVVINNPLPAGVIEVSNQGIVGVDNPDIPDEPTDDPDDPTPDDPTNTPISAKPELNAFKRDSLLVDADTSGAPSPGDTLIYTVTIVNSGNQAASNMNYTDIPDPNTALVVGSVTTSQGTVTTGNNGGDTTVAVNIGTVPGGGGVVVVTYQVTIDNPVPIGVTAVKNQGIVTVDNPGIPDIPTDDPDDPTPDDPTETPINAQPILDGFKKDILLVDADSSGGASPGDTLQYQVTIINSGNQDAPDVAYSDTPDANTTLVVGSVTTSVGTVTTGNTGGDTTVAVNIGTLAGQGGQVLVTYNVTINTPLPAEVTKVSNQGIVTDSDPRTPDDPTDDPDDPDPDDPTDTPITAAPDVDSFKRDTLLVDADGNGSPSPGDTLLYNITIINSGNQAATDLDYSDTPDPNTTLVVGSVASSAGTITAGNTAGDEGVAVDIGTLAGGGAEVNISYQAVINNPVPAGVTKVSNQGIVTSTDPKVPDEPTDDPDDPDPDDPTDTPIDASPRIEAHKRDIVFIDADDSGTPSPGDTLLYNITIVNNGNQASEVLTYTDNIDPNLTLVAGSLNTDRGTILDGSDAGDSPIVINLGPLPGGGATANISYHATINNPLPPNVTEVSNQGIVTDDDPSTPDEPTDDPDDPEPDDPTDTPIDAKPKLDAYKRDSLLVDADGNGSPSPGDTLLYNITIINSGNQAATGLVYNDNPDPHTRLVVGSVASDVGTVTQGNTDGDMGITVDISTLPGGDSVVNISYHATINNPLPAEVVQVSNQGIISSDDPDLPDTPTDDPDDPEIDDPTDTVVVAAPLIDVYKQASLLTDADSDGSPSPGDTLLYNITIFNTGNQAATGVVYDDTPDANTALVVGSVSSDHGTISSGNSAGNSSVQVNVGTLPGGSQANISYRVTINSPLPPTVVQVSNQGTTSGDNFPDEPSDDPETPGLPKDPTDVVVVAAPVLAAHKLDSLLIDADENDAASPGDTLLYNVTVINSGNTAATGVVYNDTPDANTQLVPGSVRTNLGSVTTGNGAGDTTVSVNVGEIPAGSRLEISYQVQIDDELPEDVTELRNQGVVHNDNDIMPCPDEAGASSGEAVHCPEIPTNDPSTTAAGDPTVTPLDRDPTAEEPTEQPQEQRSIFLPRINHGADN